jgi:hypothetical protein
MTIVCSCRLIVKNHDTVFTLVCHITFGYTHSSKCITISLRVYVIHNDHRVDLNAEIYRVRQVESVYNSGLRVTPYSERSTKGFQ